MLLHRITNGIIERLLTVRKNGILVVATGAMLRHKAQRVFGQSAPVAMTTTATITTAALLGGLITANQGGAGAATYTMPTGTVLQAALPKAFVVDDAFEFSIVNISTNAAEDVTVAGDTGTTAVGNMTVAANSGVTEQSWATFVVRKTGHQTFSFYRVG